MSDIDTSLELENVGTTDNGTTDAVEAHTSAPATEAAVVEAPKKISLDDALAKAWEKHTPAADGKPKTATPNSTPAETGKTIDPITGREQEPIKAPAGWTPVLREKWGSIDPTVQKFIRDRELDMAQTISKTSEERKLASEFKSAIAPFEGTIRQLNAPAINVVKDVMAQWHQMQTGTPQQKAQLIDGLIRHFQPDIPTLIALSNGQRPQVPSVTSPAPQPNVQELVQKELAAREEQQLSQVAEQSIAQFAADPKNEFYEDVRESMGKIISAGIVTGNTLPELMDKAYKLACQQHPEVQQIMATRSNTAPAAKPVRSVKPSLGTGQATKTPNRKMSIDEAVNAAWRMHSA